MTLRGLALWLFFFILQLGDLSPARELKQIERHSAFVVETQEPLAQPSWQAKTIHVTPPEQRQPKRAFRLHSVSHGVLVTLHDYPLYHFVCEEAL